MLNGHGPEQDASLLSFPLAQISEAWLKHGCPDADSS